MRLNLGCGRLRIAGYLGVDSEPGEAVNVVWDLTRHPWPWGDASVDGVIAWHSLEHLPGYELANALEEVHRVLVTGGTLYVKVPYREPGPYNPLHFHVFNRHSFNGWLRRPNGDRDSSLQHRQNFIRVRQEVVNLPSGFPLWHIAHRVPRLARIVFDRDERGLFTRFPSVGGSQELREWLVKV